MYLERFYAKNMRLKRGLIGQNENKTIPVLTSYIKIK